MFSVDSIHLKGALCFEDARFEIKPGVSVIYGLNKTTKKGKNSNGAGKSSFFSQVREICFEDPVVGHKQDAVKLGMRAIEARIGKKKVCITRNNNKLDVTAEQDGAVFKSKGKSPAKEWLSQNLPISEEEFDTYVHLDSNVSHPLVMGTSVERRRFFESFFGLDKFDIERKLFVAEYDKIKATKLTYAEVKAEYLELKEDLAKVSIEKKKKEYTAIKSELEELNSKNQRLQKVAQLITFETQVLPYLTKLRSICNEGAITEEWFMDRLKTAKWDLKHNTEGLEAALEWEQYQRDTAHYEEAYLTLSKQSKFLIKKLGEREALAKSKAKAKEYRELSDSRASIVSRLEKLKSLTKPSRPTSEVPNEDEGALTSELKVLRHKIEHAERFNKGVCGTCGQSVETVNPKKLQVRFKAVEAALEAIEEHDAYKQELKTYKEDKARLTELKENLWEADALLNSLKPYKKCYSELRDIPRRPKPYEGKKYEVSVKKRMVEEDKERLTLLQFLHPSIEIIVELENLSDKHRALAAKASILQEKINKLQEKNSKLHGEILSYKVLEEQVAKVKSKLRNLKALLVNEESLSLLVEAYSDKAMKKMAIQSISDRLMLVVNQYAKVVFPEDYTFEVNWDTSQLALLVHRRYGKKVQTSDVRRLSGAERKLFTLVLVLALMTFVPQRKRCNLLILDEPSANMGKESFQAFKDILPVINKVIPSIIIITPLSDEVYEGASVYTVVKTKGVAKIVEGHPYAQK